MKKLILALMLFAGTILPALGQRVVFDISCVETLIANHKVQQEALKSIKENEAGISALQQKISEKMVQIEYFHSKFYNSLKTVDAIIKNGKDIIYCTDIAKDIGEYQAQMVKIAVGDPELLLVSAKTEVELVNRTADLTNYIYQVVIIGTDVNLMDNKQRINLLQHVISELRSMRALAYSVCRQMKTAKRNGVLQTLMPGMFKYKDNRPKIVEEVLDGFKFKTK
ncbi:plasmid transfer protein [Phocaeicola barnesiae]|uniref:plasmid transfer protein n=1 Tax=Phocaeicola barnesiae TaxID=376804 RepID=UPI0025A48A7B|nr:plasmid transfer protein [Phocaeicola barnesiae]MDM8242880.1 plasmid transfer protein [Phocaeicola barnesiae]